MINIIFNKNYFCFIILFFLYTNLHPYGWPIESIDIQHTVTGAYGECRGESTRDHLHNGIDIDGGDNIPVYSIINGSVYGNPSKGIVIICESETGYYYTYIHLENIPVAIINEASVNTNTILGYINTGTSTHLHFTDGLESGTNYNPLSYIDPFDDNLPPVIDFVKVIKNINSTQTRHEEVSSIQEGQQVDIIVKVHDAISTYGWTNNGICEIYLDITGPGQSTPVKSFDGFSFWYSLTDNSANVLYVYAPGSWGTPSPGQFIYVPTNGYYYDDYWDTSDLMEGEYMIWVYVRDFDIGEFGFQKTIYISGSAEESRIKDIKGVTDEE